MASLIGIREFVPDIERNVTVWRSDARLQVALEADASWDKSDEISRGWAVGIQEHFSRNGISLVFPRP